MVTAAPASALRQRGHIYTASFGGEGEGGLSHPGDVAVSATSGDVYVLDRGHDRIVQYTATGAFIAAWGWGVRGAKGSWQLCTSSCSPGAPHKGFLLSGAQAIAVDNSTNPEDPSKGDVYVAAPREHEEEAYEAIEKYTPNGKPLERITKIPYTEEGETEKLEEPEAEETHGLTVGAEGTPWLYYEETLYPLNSQTLKKPAARAPFEISPSGEPANGLALDSHGRFYAGHQPPSPAQPGDVISEWRPQPETQELEELLEGLDSQNTTAITVNPADQPANQVDEQDDVYITTLSPAGAKTAASVAEYTPTHQLIQRFTAPGLSEPAGVAVNPATGTVYVTDAATAAVDLFALEEPSAPSVDSLSVQEVSSVSAQLDAQVDPDGAPTTYAFRYSPDPVPAAGEPCASPCVEVPAPEETLGEDFAAHTVQQDLKQGTPASVGPGMTYRYRVIARNPHGAGESAEGTFSTPPTSGRYIADERVWELVTPADRDGANVQAIDEAPNALAQAALDGDAITYATDGPVGETQGSRSYEPTQMLATRGSGGWSSQDIVTPNQNAASLGSGKGSGIPPEYQFFSEDLSLSLVHPFIPEELGNHAQLGKFAEPPLSPPLTEREHTEGQERTIYLRADEPIQPDGEPDSGLYGEALADGSALGNPGYVALVSDLDVLPGAEFGTPHPPGERTPVEFVAASPDLATVVLKLISAIAGAPGCQSRLSSCAQEGLYAYSDGTLQPVNVAPCEGGACEEPHLIPAELGSGHDKRGAISADGSRIFWQDTNGHLYMRDLAASPARTLQLDLVRGGSGEGAPHAVFQAASSDGSRVFFTDQQDLTPGAGAREERPDLYECQISEPEGVPSCGLSDLTTPLSPSSPEGADVQGELLGVSEDGSAVYFVADGVLTETANPEGARPEPGGCVPDEAAHWRHAVEEGRPPRQETCNLYAERYDAAHARWQTSFVAGVSGEDAPDWESDKGTAPDELEEITSRVSLNGRYLAFMSAGALTSFHGRPYDNDAAAPAAGGAAAEEVYEYDAGGEPGSEHLTCASCDPSGARPLAVFDPAYRPESGRLLADTQGSWSERWLAGSIPGWTGVAAGSASQPYALYQSRYLSDSGRLYFDSPDDLVPQATNATEDVYEYEPAGSPHGPHQCTAAAASFSERDGGCVGLISSGTSDQESAFLDASQAGGEGPGGEVFSEGGSDVFFITAAKLVPQDTEPGYSLYDAHECDAASPCVVPSAQKEPEVCESTEACRAYSPPSPLGAPASAGAGAAGNLTPNHAVLPNKTTGKPKPKPLTRTQKLTRALKACRAAHKHSRSRRVACERRAHKRYAKRSKAKRSFRTPVRPMGSRR